MCMERLCRTSSLCRPDELTLHVNRAEKQYVERSVISFASKRIRYLALAVPVALLLIDGIKAGETLYNGIVLPDQWPPRLADFPTSVEKDPVTPPYLSSPPEVSVIDVGRQLFVDDFLISETTLKRTFHLP